jgi:hypothetical protein
MRLGEALLDKNLDVRLRDKHLTDGKISASEVKKYTEALPDEEGNYTFTTEERARTAPE